MSGADPPPWICDSCSQLNHPTAIHCVNLGCRRRSPVAGRADLGVVVDCVRALLPRLRHVLRQPTAEAEVVDCYCLPQYRDERLVAVTNLVVPDGGPLSCRQADVQFRRTEAGQAILLRVHFHPASEMVLPRQSPPDPQDADEKLECALTPCDAWEPPGGAAPAPPADGQAGGGAVSSPTAAPRRGAEVIDVEAGEPGSDPEPSSSASLRSLREAQGCAYWLARMARPPTADSCTRADPLPTPEEAEPRVPLEEVQFRVLSRLEKLFWTYYDDVCRGDADAPRGRLTTEFRRFAGRVLQAVPSLLPPCHTSQAEVLRAFERTKSSAPRSYLVMLNRLGTQVVMVRQVRNSWWFLPGGKQEPQESARLAALREAYEETGFDAASHLVEVEVEMKGVARPTQVWFATDVPEDFEFIPQTVGEVADVAWRLLDSHASNQAAPDHWLARLLGWIHALQGDAQCRRGPRRRVTLETDDLICRFDARLAERDRFVGALCRYRAKRRRPAPPDPPARAESPVHCLAVSNVPPAADWRALRDVMAPFGTLHTVHLSPEAEGGGRPPALVAFRERAACGAAIAALDGRCVLEGSTAPLAVAWWPNGGEEAPDPLEAGEADPSAPPPAADRTATQPGDGPAPNQPDATGTAAALPAVARGAPAARRKRTARPSPPPPPPAPLPRRPPAAMWRSRVYREYVAAVAQTRAKRAKRSPSLQHL